MSSESLEQSARALAADLEDVLLRFRGNPDDCETLRRVANDLWALTGLHAEEQDAA